MFSAGLVLITNQCRAALISNFDTHRKYKIFIPRERLQCVKIVDYRGYRLYIYREVRLRKGILVQGLPGIGLVGKIAVDYIVDTLGLEKIAELFGPGLLLPIGNAGVFVDNTGNLQLPSYRFYLYSNASQDVLFLTSEVQPASWAQFEVAEAVLEYFQSIGGETVISVCGTSVEEPKIEVVYALARSQREKELEDLGLKKSAGGTITGACGLTPALAALRGLEGVVIMGSTATPEPNLESSREIIKVVSRLLKIEISLEGLDKMIKEQQLKREELERELEEAAEKAQEKKEGLPSWYV
ncbi:MAG: PAC2 family protein [Infirmifilum sp.]